MKKVKYTPSEAAGPFVPGELNVSEFTQAYVNASIRSQNTAQRAEQRYKKALIRSGMVDAAKDAAIAFVSNSLKG